MHRHILLFYINKINKPDDSPAIQANWTNYNTYKKCTWPVWCLLYTRLIITYHVSLFGDHGQIYFKKKLVITGLFLKFCTLQCDSNVYIYINSYPPSCPHHQVKISIAVYGGADPGVITQELLPQYLQKITDALSPY